MSAARAQYLADLRQFLGTIQKPNKPVDSVGLNEHLVESGLVDSLAIIQLVLYLEERYAIDFAASGLDPQRLTSMGSIVDLIEGAGT